MQNKPANFKKNKTQKDPQRLAHVLNRDEEEIIQTNMISSGTDEIPQQTNYKPEAPNHDFTEKYSKGKKSARPSKHTNSNSNLTERISSLKTPEEDIEFSPFIESTNKEDSEESNFDYRINEGKYTGEKDVLLQSLASLDVASDILYCLEVPEGKETICLTVALLAIHCAKLGMKKILGLSNEDPQEHSNEKEKNAKGTANSAHNQNQNPKEIPSAHHQNQNPKETPSTQNVNSNENHSSFHFESILDKSESDLFSNLCQEDDI